MFNIVNPPITLNLEGLVIEDGLLGTGRVNSSTFKQGTLTYYQEARVLRPVGIIACNTIIEIKFTLQENVNDYKEISKNPLLLVLADKRFIISSRTQEGLMVDLQGVVFTAESKVVENKKTFFNFVGRAKSMDLKKDGKRFCLLYS